MNSCSANIIVRDAEGEIGQCLDSIIMPGCFSEIVIAVDTRTKDRTLQVIDSYRSLIPIKAFWYDHHGLWDELGARNATLRESSGEYILWIDADEILDKPSGCCLLQNPGKKAFYLHQVSILSDGTYYDLPQIRLFPNVKGVRWELPIHCQIFFSLERIGIPMEDTLYRILHTGYDSPEKIRDKHVRNYPMLLGYLNEHRTNNRKRQYIMDRYNESYSYLKSNNLLGELGWVQIVAVILSAAIPYIIQGVSYKLSLDQAMKEARLQRRLNDDELWELAGALRSRFPQASLNDWYLWVRMSAETAPIRQGNDGTVVPEKEPNYFLYAAIFLALMMWVMR
jgi:hypothetical protein